MSVTIRLRNAVSGTGLVEASHAIPRIADDLNRHRAAAGRPGAAPGIRRPNIHRVRARGFSTGHIGIPRWFENPGNRSGCATVVRNLPRRAVEQAARLATALTGGRRDRTPALAVNGGFPPFFRC